MPITDDDIEFEQYRAEERHKQLLNSLKSIATALTKSEDDKVAGAINNQSEKLRSLIDILSKEEVVNKGLVSSIYKICGDLIVSNNQVIEALNNRLLPDTFTLHRNRIGETESVKVNYKPANLINT